MPNAGSKYTFKWPGLKRHWDSAALYTLPEDLGHQPRQAEALLEEVKGFEMSNVKRVRERKC